MDRDVWTIVMDAIQRATRSIKMIGRKPTFSNQLIVAMFLWSVYHNRCRSWACDRLHYGALFRPRKLPSISQFTRRIKSEACEAILQHVHQQLMACDIASSRGYFDGKALLVSPVSKDPEAARGKIAGGFAKGYKLHAFISEQRRIVTWSLMPLNVAEQSVAMVLCDYLPQLTGDALALADSNYDSHKLHRKLMQRNNVALLTPLKGQNRVGDDGHHPVTLRQMGQQRREAVSVWQNHPDLARYLTLDRNNAEGVFSVIALACGLDRLPAFVRRLERVRPWVGAKIILYHARLLAQEQLAAAA